MKKKSFIKNIIRDFHKEDLPKTVKRNFDLPERIDIPLVITGARRSGKTFLLYNFIKKKIASGINKKRFVFINFEDERLADFETKDLHLILEAYQELYPDLDLKDTYFLFDEIQNISGWEKFIRRIIDTITKKVLITGSNSRLLSKEIATSLRGRTLSFEVFPLDFREFLTFKNISLDLHHSSGKGKIINALDEFLKYGGYPEIVFLEKKYRYPVLQNYLQVMIYRDLVERFQISNLKALKFFIRQVIQTHSKEISINKIYNSLKSMKLAIGINTLYKYHEHLKDIYLAHTLNKFTYSERIKEQSEKKNYIIDNGIFNANTFRLSDDRGRVLESAVFWHLRRKNKEIFLYKGGVHKKFECDFIVCEQGKPKEAIQVCADLSSEKTYQRELDGILKTCLDLKLKEGLIISLDEEREVELQGIRINILPFYKYCLGLLEKM